MTRCDECGGSSVRHIVSWLDGLTDRCLPSLSGRFLPWRWQYAASQLFLRALITCRLFTPRSREWLESRPGVSPARNETSNGVNRGRMPIVSARTACLLQAATERGYVFEVLESRFGDVRYIRMLAKNGRRRSFVFESLPLAEFTSHYPPSRVDDKLWVKRELEKAGWPAARGRSFWFFQARAALRYGSELGWPLVVKPRGGSFSRHVTTNICTPDALQRAISHAVAYAPEFIVEQYLGGLTVHRATVVDNSFVACAKREIPSVQGDGRRTISELVAAKNEDPFRGPPEDETYVLFRITIDAVSHAVLLEQGYAWDSVPSAGVRVYLQRDPFVRLGADVIEVTDQMHPDNRELFLGVAKHFDLRLVGLDFLTEDISRSWREQHCAILELNSLPCIEIHHQPSGGKPQDVAGALLNMMDKYYG